jgi:hypothetical protein
MRDHMNCWIWEKISLFDLELDCLIDGPFLLLKDEGLDPNMR